jgi:hypothetical protein
MFNDNTVNVNFLAFGNDYIILQWQSLPGIKPNAGVRLPFTGELPLFSLKNTILCLVISHE